MRTVINIDDIKKSFLTDGAFLEYAQEIYKENESEDDGYNATIGLFMPENVQQAEEYIHKYCGNLLLTNS